MTTSSTTRSGPTPTTRSGRTPTTTSTTASSAPMGRRPGLCRVPADGAPYAAGTAVVCARTSARAPARGTSTARAAPAGGGAMAQICTGETSGLTDWPVERIAEAVNPDETQRAALNELRDAAAARRRADALGLPGRSAVDAGRPHGGDAAAARSDARGGADRAAGAREVLQVAERRAEGALQRARAGTGGACERPARPSCRRSAARRSPRPTRHRPRASSRRCGSTAEQRAALDNLDAATAKAAEMLAANCPTEETLTPPGRLAAMEGRLNAMLQALDVVQPALAILRLAHRRAEGALQPARRPPAGQPLTTRSETQNEKGRPRGRPFQFECRVDVTPPRSAPRARRRARRRRRASRT